MGHRRPSERPAWEDAFVTGLRQYGSIKRAAHAAGVTHGAYQNRQKNSDTFRKACAVARADFAARGAKLLRNGKDKPALGQWKRAFLDALGETSNVTAAADRAGVSTREVYNLRRKDEGFAAEWHAALFEGYANLEMEVLCYLRDPAPERKMDVAAALRLLAAHKDTIAAERATRANVSAAEVRASIGRKVDALREQLLAERERQKAANG